MAWEKLKRVTTSKIVPDVSVRITPEPKRRLVVLVSRGAVGRAGLNMGVGRCDVFTGTGADAGMLRIAPDKRGEWACSAYKVGSVKITARPPEGSPQTFERARADAEIADGAIVLRLPWHKRASDRVVEGLQEAAAVEQGEAN